MMREFKKQFVPRPKLVVPLLSQENSSFTEGKTFSENIFSLAGRKELEIGAGNGEFAIQKAKNCPNSHFVAIEKSRCLFNRMKKKYQIDPLPNLWIFHTNAVWWITHFVVQCSLDKIYILYPNTYKKSRQANLRWFNRPFMSHLLKCLKLGAELEIRTNEEHYYEECKLKMRNYPFVKKTQDFNLVKSPCTAFERKYMVHHKQVCRALVYTRLF